MEKSIINHFIFTNFGKYLYIMYDKEIDKTQTNINVIMTDK